LSGYEVKFTLKGKNEEERQKYLLTTYASSDYQNWNIWVNSALEYHIDPSFLMCVGLAETTLGNRMKTENNIGNIYTFMTPQEGIDWMGKTLNNRFLAQYTHVSELSRWGNEAGAIYASSNANWHNNVIRCLSAMKGRFVEDDYTFRIVE